MVKVEDRREYTRRELDKLGDVVFELEKSKVSFKLFISAVGGFGILLSMILTSTIALHIAFSRFKIDVVDRITCVDKNVSEQIAEIKVEIANMNIRRYKIRRDGWENLDRSK